jgi:type I site-specific restriction endonuclease
MTLEFISSPSFLISSKGKPTTFVFCPNSKNIIRKKDSNAQAFNKKKKKPFSRYPIKYTSYIEYNFKLLKNAEESRVLRRIRLITKKFQPTISEIERVNKNAAKNENYVVLERKMLPSVFSSRLLSFHTQKSEGKKYQIPLFFIFLLMGMVKCEI